MRYHVQERGYSNMPEPSYTYRAVVRRVVDADTVVLDIDHGRKIWAHGVRCQLHGIDAPECRGAEGGRGLKAKARLEGLITDLTNGGKVIIATQRDATGKYGRDLITLYTEAGEDLGGILVREGFAKKVEEA